VDENFTYISYIYSYSSLYLFANIVMRSFILFFWMSNDSMSRDNELSLAYTISLVIS